MVTQAYANAHTHIEVYTYMYTACCVCSCVCAFVGVHYTRIFTHTYTYRGTIDREYFSGTKVTWANCVISFNVVNLAAILNLFNFGYFVA